MISRARACTALSSRTSSFWPGTSYDSQVNLLPLLWLIAADWHGWLSVQVDIRYEVLPAVFDPREAMRPEAVRVHDNGNVLLYRKMRKGKIDEGFAAGRCDRGTQLRRLRLWIMRTSSRRLLWLTGTVKCSWWNAAARDRTTCAMKSLVCWAFPSVG